MGGTVVFIDRSRRRAAADTFSAEAFRRQSAVTGSRARAPAAVNCFPAAGSAERSASAAAHRSAEQSHPAGSANSEDTRARSAANTTANGRAKNSFASSALGDEARCAAARASSATDACAKGGERIQTALADGAGAASKGQIE